MTVPFTHHAFQVRVFAVSFCMMDAVCLRSLQTADPGKGDDVIQLKYSSHFSFLSLKDIRENGDGHVVVFGVQFSTSPASQPHRAPPSGDGGERCCCCLLENSLRHTTTSVSIVVFIVGAQSHLVLFVIVCAITFHKARQGPHRADCIAPACAQVKVL